MPPITDLLPAAAPGAPSGRARRRRLRLLAAAGVVVLAAAGYAWLIPIRSADDARLAQLAPAGSPSGYRATPQRDASVVASQTGLSRLVAAAKATPDGTGAYGVRWAGSTKGTKGATAEALVALAPSVSDAASIRAQARTRYLGAKTMKAAGYALDRTFSVPTVRNAHGAVFTPSGGSTSTSTGTVAEVVMGTGRAVVVFYVDAGAVGAAGAATARTTATSLAVADQAVLDRTEPGFSLVVTSFPLVASCVFAAGAAAALLGVVLVPGTAGRVRHRRLEARRRAAERERLARGRKVVRRHAAAPAQSRSPGRWW